MRILAIISILLLTSNTTVTYTPKLSIPGKFTKIYSDAWNNTYLVNTKNHLIKIDTKGDTLYSFQDKANQISFCDVSNPLRILALDEEQNQISILDKTLSINGTPILIDDLNILNTNVIAGSRDNRFWIYDKNLQELKKIDLNLKQFASSGPLNGLIGKTLNPIYMLQKNNVVYVSDSTHGLYQFDQNGAFLGSIHTRGIQKFQVKGENVLYLQNDSLAVLNTKFSEINKHPLPKKNIVDFSLSDNHFFALTKDTAFVFSINLPSSNSK